jgi:hypothetical protein
MPRSRFSIPRSGPFARPSIGCLVALFTKGKPQLADVACRRERGRGVERSRPPDFTPHRARQFAGAAGPNHGARQAAAEFPVPANIWTRRRVG